MRFRAITKGPEAAAPARGRIGLSYSGSVERGALYWRELLIGSVSNA